MSELNYVLSKWRKLGTSFNVEPCKETPNIENLIILSARYIPEFSRLLPMLEAWLSKYEVLVCRHHLARMVSQLQDQKSSAILGYLFSRLRAKTESKHFNIVIKQCKPLFQPEPLFHVDQKNDKTKAFAERFSEPEAIEWGLWASHERPYESAIMDSTWLMKENPTLHYRALFSGKLQATIISVLLESEDHGQSETRLSKACNVTRVALRDALEHLDLCGYIQRLPEKKRSVIKLINIERITY